MTCLIYSSMLTNRMIRAINARLPPDQRLSGFGSWPMKIIPVCQAYGELYPDGNLARPMSFWGTFGLIIFALSCALLLHILAQA